MVDIPYKAKSRYVDMKPVHWVGSSQEDLKDFPKEALVSLSIKLSVAANIQRQNRFKDLAGQAR